MRQAFGVEAIMCHEMAWGRNTAEVMFIGPAGGGRSPATSTPCWLASSKAARAEVHQQPYRQAHETSTKRLAPICSARAGATGCILISVLVPSERRTSWLPSTSKHHPNLSAGESRSAKATKRDQSASLHGWIAAKQVG